MNTDLKDLDVSVSQVSQAQKQRKTKGDRKMKKSGTMVDFSSKKEYLD